MKAKRWRKWITLAAGAISISVLFSYCAQQKPAKTVMSSAAEKVYVAPGDYDEFYGFFSGGFSGQVSIVGIPSGRFFRNISVFSQNPETGWGYSEETKPMLETTYGFIPWDDAHHPKLSQTNGVPDGRWLFINGTNTCRIARIDLTTFETDEIIEIPNAGGNHASPFVTMNTEYVVGSTRFSVPVPQQDIGIDTYKGNFKGTITYVKVAPEGKMNIAFQILMPGYNYDLSHSGKGVSHGWSFFTSYNSEEANTLLEVNASKNDKDYIAAVNWKKAEEYVQQGKAKEIPGKHYRNYMDHATHMAKSDVINTVKVLDPRECPGLVYYLPTPKSPHGVDIDPSGEYIASGGKLAAIIPVHSFSKMLQAIADKAFEGEVDGIPVLKYDAVIAGEVQNPGLGPLHTEFDGKGYGYTSSFISSEIVKWKLGTWEIVDRVPAYYSIGHLMIPGGDSMKPWGKYVIALNKVTKDRYLPTGPELCHAAQLYDISGDKMELLLDFPTVGEPHYAQAIPADLLTPNAVKFFELSKNQHPYGIKSEAEARVTREGNKVHVYMSTIRTHFMPDNIEGIQMGDEVYFHVTNLEQDWDVPHGFAVLGANNSELLVMPGQTRTLKWNPNRAGVFPFYCTDFCSALHQEMSGYVRVSPKGTNTPIKFTKRG